MPQTFKEPFERTGFGPLTLEATFEDPERNHIDVWLWDAKGRLQFNLTLNRSVENRRVEWCAEDRFFGEHSYEMMAWFVSQVIGRVRAIAADLESGKEVPLAA